MESDRSSMLCFIYVTRRSNIIDENLVCETETEIMRKVCTNDSSNASARAQCRNALCISVCSVDSDVPLLIVYRCTLTCIRVGIQTNCIRKITLGLIL